MISSVIKIKHYTSHRIIKLIKLKNATFFLKNYLISPKLIKSYLEMGPPTLLKKIENHGILAMCNSTSILSPCQLIIFPLIANGNGTLNLPALSSFPTVLQTPIGFKAGLPMFGILWVH